MKKNKILNHLLVERINKIIVETSGINDELDSRIMDVANYIISQSKKEKNYKHEDNLSYYSGSLKDNLFNKDFVFYYTILKFNNEEEYNGYINKYGELNDGFWKDKDRYFIKLYLVLIDGRFNYRDFYDGIYHEVEHAFQTIKSGKDFGGENLNAYIRSKLRDKNIWERVIAEIIYATRKNEQDAMVNGMWGYVNSQLKQNAKYWDVDKLIIDSEASVWLKKLYDNIALILTNKDNEKLMKVIDYYSHNFDINYGRLLSITKKGIKAFEEKIAKVTRRLKQKHYNNVNEYISSRRIIGERGKKYCLRLIFD